MIALCIAQAAILNLVFVVPVLAVAANGKPAIATVGKLPVSAPAGAKTSAPQVTVQSFPPVSCAQSHPGEGERTRDVFSKGDSHMSKAVSTHVVKYAMQRFRLEPYVAPADIVRAESEIYSFLKWKLGNPSAIAGQFATAGYQHFDRAFSYEAAAVLVGGSIPQETKPEFSLPQSDVDKLKADAQKDGERLETYLQKKYHVPPGESDQVVKKLVDAAQASVSHLGFNMPKSWAIDENVAVVMIGEKMTNQARPAATVPTAKTAVR